MKTVWIRSGSFDLLWVLSGLPLGLALTLLTGWVPAIGLVFLVILAFQTGHTIAPMALAWQHCAFRAMMLRRWEKFVLLPAAILCLATLLGFHYGGQMRVDPRSLAIAAGPQSWSDLRDPFMAMVALYAFWNGWHFGRQAFGVMSVYRRKSGAGGRRWVDLWYCCVVVWAALLMPFVPLITRGIHNLVGWPLSPHPFLERVQLAYFAAALALPAAMLLHEWLTTRSLPRAIFILTDGVGLLLIFHAGLWGFAIISLNHWLVAIGLASHFHNRRRPWPFALGVCVGGFVLYALLFVNLSGVWANGLMAAALVFTPTAVAFRLGLGFVHFLYDRWLYKGTSPIWRPAAVPLQEQTQNEQSRYEPA